MVLIAPTELAIGAPPSTHVQSGNLCKLSRSSQRATTQVPDREGIMRQVQDYTRVQNLRQRFQSGARRLLRQDPATTIPVRLDPVSSTERIDCQ